MRATGNGCSFQVSNSVKHQEPHKRLRRRACNLPGERRGVPFIYGSGNAKNKRPLGRYFKGLCVAIHKP